MASETEPSRAQVTAEARIMIEGRDADVDSLCDWLQHEPELHGRLRVGSAPAPDEAMGVPIELVVVLATATVSVASALARSLSTWLIQRRSDLTVTVTGPDGRQVSLTSSRVKEPEKLLRAVLEPMEPECAEDAVTPFNGAEEQ